ncbi:SET domain-containing protein [Burkholderia gladioli]|uniref:SET domain-containing protein n=1 Tax=Burkholderia gladioli TaxID=28095 RepID=UPI003B98772B
MRRVVVRRSAVHGRGVFAAQFLHTGELIFEYKGEVITWQSAIQRYEHRDDDGHTFLFGLSDGMVIDGGRGGNSARWLNHACAPNCEAIEMDGRVFVSAVRNIQSDEELLIDYALEVNVARHIAIVPRNDVAAACPPVAAPCSAARKGTARLHSTRNPLRDNA